MLSTFLGLVVVTGFVGLGKDGKGKNLVIWGVGVGKLCHTVTGIRNPTSWFYNCYPAKEKNYRLS